MKSYFTEKQGLAAVAAFNIARGDEQSVEEAVELLNEACATTTESDEHEEPTATAQEEENEKEGGAAASAATSKVVRLAHASVLSTAAQGELVLERGTATASERLGKALRIREQLLPSGHPATVRGHEATSLLFHISSSIGLVYLPSSR